MRFHYGESNRIGMVVVEGSRGARDDDELEMCSVGALAWIFVC